MKICLIIINYNGQEFLNKHLRYLKNECQNNNIDLLVTDDKSKDDSIQILIDNKVSFTINNSKNGFASNVNNGIRYILKKNYDCIIISNNDIDPTSVNFGYLYNSIKNIISKTTDLALIGFKEITDNKTLINLEPLVLNETKEIPGFFFCIVVDAIEKIGLLDEDYFMYGEDNDYFHRTLKNNLKIIQTNIPVYHKSEGSTKNIYKTSWLVYRNSGLFAVKNLTIYKSLKLLLTFIYIIYNPFYKNDHPSVKRIKRSGFLVNNLFLVGSICWNIIRIITNLIKNVK